MFDVETYAIIKKRIASGIGGSTSGSTINDAEISEDTMLSSQKIVDTVCPPFSVSGPIVQCTPVENYELGVKVDITPVQEGEGDPSPENVRPIVGWEAVNVTRCGKNLFDISTISTNSEIKNNGDSLTVNTALSSVRCPTKESFHKICHGVPSNIEYNFNAITTSDLKQVYFNSGVLWSFATSKNVDDSMQQSPIYFYGNTINESGIISDIQLELGSVKTSYEPYRGETIAVALGQTVYGGTLDVRTGTLTVTHGIIILNSNFLQANNWIFGTGGVQTTPCLIGEIPGAKDAVGRISCSHFKETLITPPINNNEIYAQKAYFNYKTVAIRNDDWTDLQTAKNWLDAQENDGNPVQIIFELNDSFTIQLIHQQITSISGTNTLYADAGNITVTGVSDPGAAIATLQDRLTALENNTLN